MPDAMRAAALSEREEKLVDKIRFAGETQSYRRLIDRTRALRRSSRSRAS